jgi:L-ascorbate metabolism protein UlaG (beta-lactamase superfamily)
MGMLLPPVMGTLLEHRVAGVVSRRVYLSGDTLTGDHLDDIGARHPDIDLAVVHLGGTRVLMHTVTMDGKQGFDFLSGIKPREAVPVHYDDYRVLRSPLGDFLGAVERSGLPSVVRPVGRGDTVELR